jgi:DNA polymerase-3 subunit delta
MGMPTYVLYGKETYLLEDEVKGIIQEFTNNTNEDLNVVEFDMLFKIKVLQNGTKDKDLIGILGCHPYVLQKLKEQIKEFKLSRDDVGNILCILTEAVNDMKMGKDSYLTMEISITKVSDVLRVSPII